MEFKDDKKVLSYEKIRERIGIFEKTKADFVLISLLNNHESLNNFNVLVSINRNDLLFTISVIYGNVAEIKIKSFLSFEEAYNFGKDIIELNWNKHEI